MPNPNEIKIIGEIGEDAPGAVQFKKLTALADPSKELIVRIDSKGGNLLDAISMRDVMATWPAGSVAIVEPLAASAASYLLTGAKTVKASENGWIMLHNPKTVVEGDDDEILSVGGQVKRFKDQMITAYAERMKMPAEDVKAVLKSETWYSAQNALELGLVDEVLQINRPSVFSDRTSLPQQVVASLKSSLGNHNQNFEKEKPAMTKSPQEFVKAIKTKFPKASSDFIVKAMDEGMSEEDMSQKILEELYAKVDTLETQLKAAMDEKSALELANQQVSAKVVALETTVKNLGTASGSSSTGVKAVVKPVGGTSDKGAGSAVARWKSAVQECKAKGLNHTAAVAAVDRDFPGLREEMIAEVN